MKFILFPIFYCAMLLSGYGQVEAHTLDGKKVLLYPNGRWTYVTATTGGFQPLGKSLIEQYDEVAEYARLKLDLDVNSYSYAEKEEARAYVKKFMEENSHLNTTDKTLVQQYDEVARYARLKLNLNVNSYTYSEKEKAQTYVKEFVDTKGQLNTSGKKLEQQYDEVAEYARVKLGLHVNSYSYSTRDKARAYVKKFMEEKSHLDTIGKTLSQQYEEVARYARLKLELDVYSYCFL